MITPRIVGTGGFAKGLSVASGLQLESLFVEPLSIEPWPASEIAGLLFVQTAGSGIDSSVSLIRRAAAADCSAIIWILGPDLLAIERGLAIGSIEPLGIELAPATRLSLVDTAPGARIEDVWAAARFLLGATCTTGQILRINGDPIPSTS